MGLRRAHQIYQNGELEEASASLFRNCPVSVSHKTDATPGGGKARMETNSERGLHGQKLSGTRFRPAVLDRQAALRVPRCALRYEILSAKYGDPNAFDFYRTRSLIAIGYCPYSVGKGNKEGGLCNNFWCCSKDLFWTRSFVAASRRITRQWNAKTMMTSQVLHFDHGFTLDAFFLVRHVIKTKRKRLPVGKLMMSLVSIVVSAWVTFFACTSSPVSAFGVTSRRLFLYGAGSTTLHHSCLKSSKRSQSGTSSNQSGTWPKVIIFGKRPILLRAARVRGMEAKGI
eukprot:scaffold9477_cov197-Amphora_coffeaeformis.AAC.13